MKTKFKNHSVTWRVLMTNELKHYGVLGMKWGKRKAKPSTGMLDMTIGANGRLYYHDSQGVYVESSKTLYPWDVKRVNKYKAKGMSTMDSFVYKKHDKIGGEYGDRKISQLWTKYGDRAGVYKAKFEKGTKVASPKHARDAFVKEFKEDKRFREHLSKAIKDMEISGRINTPERRKAVDNLNKALQGKKKFLRGSVYDGFTTVIKDNNTHSTNANLDYFSALSRKGINAVVDRDSKKLASIKAKSPILRGHGHGANRFGFGFESLKDESLIGIFDRQLARNRKRRK